MRNSIIRAIMLAATFALAGCGGGGGTDVASTPPPPPPPPAPPPEPPPIIPAATTSRQFSAVGASHPIDDWGTPQLGAGDQLQVRYVASSNSYEVQLPGGQTWSAIQYTPTGGSPINFIGGGAHLVLWSEDYQYSRLFEWSADNFHGYEAIGIPTAAGNVPRTGSASYSGEIAGFTPESNSSDTQWIVGSVEMTFNFEIGSLSGSISPVLTDGAATYSLGTIDFRNTVYSTGSMTFSGEFDTNLAGVNSFSGLFTGPNAQELIGNFALPYKSPIDSQTYQAGGAFVAKK